MGGDFPPVVEMLMEVGIVVGAMNMKSGAQVRSLLSILSNLNSDSQVRLVGRNPERHCRGRKGHQICVFATMREGDTIDEMNKFQVSIVNITASGE